MSDNTFEMDVAAFAKALQYGQPNKGKDGLLTSLIKQITEAALAGEKDQHLASDSMPNRRNGSTRTTIQTLNRHFELDTPRDPNGSFELQTVKKYQTRLTDAIKRKVPSLFALGNSYQNIREHLIWSCTAWRSPTARSTRLPIG